jgi:two-component system sensor kinase FixL
MSQGAVYPGIYGRVKERLVAVTDFFKFREIEKKPGARREFSADPGSVQDARSFKSRVLFLSIALCTFLLAALAIYSALLANHLLASKLLLLEASQTLGFGIATVLLLFEAIVIFAFAVQDRHRRGLADLLKQSEDRLEFAAQSGDVGLWAWDADTDRFWATTHCSEMFGILPGTEYSMAAMRETIHPDDRAMVEEAIVTGVKSRTTSELEYRTSIASGSLRWVRCRFRCTVDENGKVLAISGTIVDVTKRKTIEAEVESQKRSLSHLTRVGMLGDLSGALAHELSQPLTAIMSNAQAAQRMIGREPIDVVELRSTIADIIANDIRANEVIRHLRALLKKEDTRRERLDLNAVVREALDLTRSDLIAKKVSVSLHGEPEAMFVLGDAVQLQQLLLNLIMNATEAMAGASRDGGKLTLSLVTEVDGVRHIAISDTGPGIRAEIMANLFDPFFSTKAQGLGLGLSIGRSIAEAHGGHLWAENNAGRGATFHVTLPPLREGMA